MKPSISSGVGASSTCRLSGPGRITANPSASTLPSPSSRARSPRRAASRTASCSARRRTCRCPGAARCRPRGSAAPQPGPGAWAWGWNRVCVLLPQVRPRLAVGVAAVDHHRLDRGVGVAARGVGHPLLHRVPGRCRRPRVAVADRIVQGGELHRQHLRVLDAARHHPARLLPGRRASPSAIPSPMAGPCCCSGAGGGVGASTRSPPGVMAFVGLEGSCGSAGSVGRGRGPQGLRGGGGQRSPDRGSLRRRRRARRPSPASPAGPRRPGPSRRPWPCCAARASGPCPARRTP